MSKNIVFIIAVKKDGQLKPEYEIGIESWRRWCKKNDVELFLLEEPVLPMNEMHIIWQRYFLFDIRKRTRIIEIVISENEITELYIFDLMEEVETSIENLVIIRIFLKG